MKRDGETNTHAQTTDIVIAMSIGLVTKSTACESLPFSSYLYLADVTQIQTNRTLCECPLG